MSAPTVNKMPHSAANLPLRFGRTVEEERSTGVMANLPLRFGRNIKESISRHVPNLPQRFGRTTAKSVAKTLSDLLQQFMHSPSASELLHELPASRNPEFWSKTPRVNTRKPVKMHGLLYVAARNVKKDYLFSKEISKRVKSLRRKKAKRKGNKYLNWDLQRVRYKHE